MKNFTFLLALMFAALVSGAQNSDGLQKKIEATKGKSAFYESYRQMFDRNQFTLAPGRNLMYPANLKSAAATMKLDSVVSKIQNTETSQLENEYKDEYFYNEQMQNTTWQYYQWEASTNSWSVNSKSELEYNAQGQFTKIDTYEPSDENQELLITGRLNIFYGEDGRIDSVINWSTEDQVAWQLLSKQVYHYNEAKQIAEIVVMVRFDEETEVLVPSARHVFAYNNDGKLESESTYYPMEEEELLSSRIKYHYDNEGRQTHSETEEINFWTLILENSDRSDYEYNAGGDIITQTYSTWNSGTQSWVPDETDEYLYNNFNFSDVYAYGYPFQLFMAESLIYPAKAIKEIETKQWVGGSLQPYGKTFFHYSEGTASSAGEVNVPRFLVYPNPVKDHVTFTWNENTPTLLLEIYQVSGGKITEKQISSGAAVSVAGLNKGIYVFRLKDGNKTIYAGKLVK